MTDGNIRMSLDLSIDVVAAAPGEVWKIAEGNFDRCFGDQTKENGINCNRRDNNTPANYVLIKMDDDRYAGYYHLEKNSVPTTLRARTDSRPGTRVKCGDKLGRVGSSGRSAYPHLHFNLSENEDPNESGFIDPYKEGLWLSLTRSRIPNGKCPLQWRPDGLVVSRCGAGNNRYSFNSKRR